MIFIQNLLNAFTPKGLQKLGPVGPGGFGQNILGQTKGNLNSQQIMHNAQQI